MTEPEPVIELTEEERRGLALALRQITEDEAEPIPIDQERLERLVERARRYNARRWWKPWTWLRR